MFVLQIVRLACRLSLTCTESAHRWTLPVLPKQADMQSSQRFNLLLLCLRRLPRYEHGVAETRQACCQVRALQLSAYCWQGTQVATGNGTGLLTHQVGAFESSKSAMNTLAPELRALMTILRSTGPVISTRRSNRSAGRGATCRQRMCTS